MPPAKTTSSLVTMLGDRFKAAYEKYRHDETEFSAFGDLPAGIENGVAQLYEVKFDKVAEGKKNEGVPYFYASATVVHPEMFDGTPIKGLQTRIMKVLAEGDGYEKAAKKVTNWLRLIGIDTRSVDFKDLETHFAAVKQMAPFIRFRTWKGSKQELKNLQGKWFLVDDRGRVQKGPWPTEEIAKKFNPYAGEEPRVNHDWNGVVKNWTGAIDPYASAVSVNGQEVSHTPGGIVQDFDDQGDLDSLARRALEGDDDAIAELTKHALAAGLTNKQVQDADTWPDLVTMIMSQPKGAVQKTPEVEPAVDEEGSDEVEDDPAVEEEVEEDAPWVPAVGDVYYYRPIDPKTKKPMKDPKTKKDKIIEVEVLSVEEKSETVTIKDSATDKPVMGANKRPASIKWSELTDETGSSS